MRAARLRRSRRTSGSNGSASPATRTSSTARASPSCSCRRTRRSTAHRANPGASSRACVATVCVDCLRAPALPAHRSRARSSSSVAIDRASGRSPTDSLATSEASCSRAKSPARARDRRRSVSTSGLPPVGLWSSASAARSAAFVASCSSARWKRRFRGARVAPAIAVQLGGAARAGRGRPPHAGRCSTSRRRGRGSPRPRRPPPRPPARAPRATSTGATSTRTREVDDGACRDVPVAELSGDANRRASDLEVRGSVAAADVGRSREHVEIRRQRAARIVAMGLERPPDFVPEPEHERARPRVPAPRSRRGTPR